jgi:hypothetical protein
MSRRSILLAIGFLLLLTCGATTVLALLVRYEPHHYTEAAVPPGPQRTQYSLQCWSELQNLINGVNLGEGSWQVSFTNDQINSYLEEKFIQDGLSEHLLPTGINQPRFTIEPDKIRIAFRYGTGFWSTIISLDLRIWVARGVPNAIGLELVSFKAGALPISAQSLLEDISQKGRDNGIDVSWYRWNGHPVAILRFQKKSNGSTLHLEQVHLAQGVLTIIGRPLDATADGGMIIPVRALKPHAH